MLAGVNYVNFYDITRQQAELSRLYHHIVQNVQNKKQRQGLTVLIGILGLGYLLSQKDDDEYENEY